jgi:hypothetical protein
MLREHLELAWSAGRLVLLVGAPVGGATLEPLSASGGKCRDRRHDPRHRTGGQVSKNVLAARATRGAPRCAGDGKRRTPTSSVGHGTTRRTVRRPTTSLEPRDDEARGRGRRRRRDRPDVRRRATHTSRPWRSAGCSGRRDEADEDHPVPVDVHASECLQQARVGAQSVARGALLQAEDPPAAKVRPRGARTLLRRLRKASRLRLRAPDAEGRDLRPRRRRGGRVPRAPRGGQGLEVPLRRARLLAQAALAPLKELKAALLLQKSKKRSSRAEEEDTHPLLEKDPPDTPPLDGRLGGGTMSDA